MRSYIEHPSEFHKLLFMCAKYEIIQTFQTRRTVSSFRPAQAVCGMRGGMWAHNAWHTVHAARTTLSIARAVPPRSSRPTTADAHARYTCSYTGDPRVQGMAAP